MGRLITQTSVQNLKKKYYRTGIPAKTKIKRYRTHRNLKFNQIRIYAEESL